jgi:hypothetical protein
LELWNPQSRTTLPRIYTFTTLPTVPRPPEWSLETERDLEQKEAWRLSLFEWCLLLSQVEELIEEVNRSPQPAERDG